MKNPSIIEERINKIADKIAKIITTIPHPKSFPKGKGLETPLLWRGVGVRLFQKSLSFLLILSFVTSWSYSLLPGLEKYSPEVKKAEATGSPWQIRQEINIIDGYLEATTGNYATSSGIVYLDKTKYSGTVTYYFEVVASTTVGISGDVYLRSTSGVTYATASYDTSATSPTLWRSSSFTPPSSATDLVAVIDNESGATKSIKAARIVIIQYFPDTAGSAATSTQTQIEIGNEETGKTNTSNSALNFPKYWTYSSSKWDGTQTSYVEVTYKNGAQLASSTTYNVSATTTTTQYTYVGSTGVSYVTIEAWGPGGGGDGVTSAATIGGGGGGGGAYVRSTTTVAAGSSNHIGVGRGGAEGSATTASSTYLGADGFVARAAGGTGADSTTGAAGGTVANSTGQVAYAGGSGGTGEGTVDTGAG